MILKLSWFIALTLIIVGNAVAQTPNLRFDDLKKEVFSDPYTELPQYRVNKQFFGSERDESENKLLNAARRTFDSSDDFIAQATEPKLLNANGICFAGVWRITQDSEYTGLYGNGSSAPTIVRASVALSGTKQKDKRAFGLAIKLLPNDLQQQASLNAFVLNSMGGAISKNVLDLSLDNEPPLGRLPRLSDLTTALRLRRDLEKADKEYGATKPDVSFRPVNALAEYGVNSQDTISPRWLQLTVLDAQRVDQDDFRDELRVEQYSNNIISYQISVAGNNQDTSTKKKDAQWKTLGVLELNESVSSPNCDINLHFQHPQLN